MSSEERSTTNYQVPALDRGLDLLECLARGGSALTQAQLARELNRRPTEIFRALTTLERRGYIQRDLVSGAYRLTLRLFELGHTHSPFEGLIEAADQPMRDLAEEIGQACHLSVMDYDQVLVLHQVESRSRVRISIEIGSTHPLVRSASGRVLIAALDASRTTRIMEELQVSPESEARLNRRLNRIRSRGYEEAYSESIAGVTDLAILVGSPEGKVNAALAVAALPAERGAFLRETIEPLRRCATRIGVAAGLVIEGER